MVDDYIFNQCKMQNLLILRKILRKEKKLLRNELFRENKKITIRIY